MKYIIFDLEIFQYDALLGAFEFDDVNHKYEFVQLWNRDKISEYAKERFKTHVWIGHNNFNYDNRVLMELIKYGESFAYNLSKDIVRGGVWETFHKRTPAPFLTWDTMLGGMYSLKLTEWAVGESICENELGFDFDRPLTEEERKKIEEYNYRDVFRTWKNFTELEEQFILKLTLISDFKLPASAMYDTQAQIAAECLHCNRVYHIEKMKIAPKIYDNLKIKNKDVIDFYLSEGFRTGKNIQVTLCGVEHTLGAGGIHGAKKRIQRDKALYFDVSGYYNLIMLNYDLLPRGMNAKSRELYQFMYKEQLRLKKINPLQRKVYKTILLAVFGSMLNPHSKFYDPERGTLVTITGQLFLVDLLEKLEPYVELLQSNTDGIIVVPNDWNEEQKIISIVEEWEKRTGFTIKKDVVTKLYQRDVNNYCCFHNGEIETHGEALKHFGDLNAPVRKQSWSNKEAMIIPYAIVEFLMHDVPPEETIERNKDNLIMFQFSCKPNSFLYLTFDTEKESKKLQKINRAFAAYPNKGGKVYKHKEKDGKEIKSLIAGLPPQVFIFNHDIRKPEYVERLKPHIYYEYYIKRAYERIGEFFDGLPNEEGNRKDLQISI